MECCRENVRQEGQVADLLHGLVLVWEAEQLKVGIGHKQVFRLSTLPIAEIEPVGSTGDIWIRSLADFRPARPAIATPAARDIERHRDEIAFLEESNIGSELNYLASHFVSHDHALGHWERATVDVEVASADIRSDNFQYDTVRCFCSVGHLQFWEVEIFDLHVLWISEHYCAIAISHDSRVLP